MTQPIHQTNASGRRWSGLTNRASTAGAGLAGALCARSVYPTPPAHKRNGSLLGRARQLQAPVRRRSVLRKLCVHVPLEPLTIEIVYALPDCAP